MSRSLEETLDAAWLLLADFPAAELKRIPPDLGERYRPSPKSLTLEP